MRALAQRCSDAADRTEVDEHALSRAAQFGRVSDVEYLLELGAEVGWTGSQGWSVLQWTARALQIEDSTQDSSDPQLDADKAEVVRILVAAGAQIDAAGEAGRTPLMDAAMFGFAQTAVALMDAGADTNARDENGWTPLMYAAQGSGSVDLISSMLANGANPEAQNGEGRTAEQLPRRQGSEHVAEVLAAG
jgi:ankyrin repeat protein